MTKREAVRVGLIGCGRVGQEVRRRIEQAGDTIVFVETRSGLQLPDGSTGQSGQYPAADIVYLAIPTADDGRAAKEYIGHFRNAGIPVVTCEKGALSEYYAELAPQLDGIGLSAAVGGGTRMLHYVRERMSERVEEVHAVVNGTLNFIMDGVAGGQTLDRVVAESRKLGYAEPDGESVLGLFNGEACGDVPKKAAILFNYGFGAAPIKASAIQALPLQDADLETLERDAAQKRYVVSFTRSKDGSEPDPGGFVHQAGAWQIRGGFRQVDEDPLFAKLLPSGVDNAVYVSEGAAGYLLDGPGAGPEPTAAAMLQDGRALLRRSTSG